MFSQDGLFDYRKDMVGEQWLYRFPNNYGASVIRKILSYGSGKGLYELAVIKWGYTEIEDKDDWTLTYKTPITDDVIGCCSDQGIDRLLNQIKELNTVA